jgi:hypothetical protein
MKLSILGRYAFGAALAVAILAGCGTNSGGDGVPSKTALNNTGTHRKTFSYTGGEQTFKVPSGVKAITIDATGAAGAGFVPKRIGRGGRIVATVPVTQGETLYVFVAGEGSSSTAGFNGGGSGGCRPSYGDCGDGGGGASDVREGGNGLSNRIVVAGGGGGEGFKRTAGGLGGGLVGGMGKGRKPSGHGIGGFGGAQAGHKVPAAQAALAAPTTATPACPEHWASEVAVVSPAASFAAAEVVAAVTTAAEAAAADHRAQALAAERAAVAAADRPTQSPMLKAFRCGKDGNTLPATV